MNTPPRLILALATGSLLAVSSAPAQSTYIWANSNVAGTPPANLDWFTGGPNTQGTWTGGTPVSSNLNTIQFFANAATQLTNTAAPSTQAVNLNNGGTAFQLGTLTLTGRASATSNANLTMNLSGDALNFSAATGTVNLNAINATRTITYNVANNIQLGTASSASNLTLTGNGDNGTGFNFSGSVSELQIGGGSKLIKSGSSTAILSGAVTVSGGVEVNSGTLILSGSSNAITGGFTLNGGVLRYTNATTVNGSNIMVNGTASFLQHTGSSTTDATITLNTGSNLSLGADANSQTITSAVTGAGSLTVNRAGGPSSTINLNNTANTFTGNITFTNIGSTLTLNINSLVDSVGAGNIRYTGTNFAGGIASYIFNLGSGAVAPLTLNNRQIEFTSTSTVGGVIGNNSSQAFTINTDLLVSSTTNPILYLGGTGSGLSSFNGLIANGTAASVSITKRDSGTWALSGANTYTGKSYNNSSNGTLIFQNATQSLPSSSALTIAITNNQNQTTRLLSDSAGTINLGNTLRSDGGGSSGTGTMTIFVGNNGSANGGNGAGGTTGSTIVLGTLDLRSNQEGGLVDQRMAARVGVTGANGYNLQIGDVILQARGTTSAAGAFFQPTSASLTITGTVKQNNGRTGADNAGLQTMTLDGTASGNVISGAVKNATDFDDLSNANAQALNITKSNTSTWTLSGANTYSGLTTVSGGTLAGVGANAFGSTSDIRIAAAGTLSLRGDSSTSFVKASDSSPYSVTTTASGATLNADQATIAGTGAKTMTIGTLGTTSTAATYQVNFTGANNTSLSMGAATGAASTAGRHRHVQQ
jgi:fibronectin-binding autotransporter adhesin